ncbi:MAG: hypothetical protein H7070_16840 [Saprospiraceae bacterium]|nr:hypothetical protein [Pyrinomonadaceae bacterium]
MATFFLLGFLPSAAQNLGSLEVSGRVKIEGKQEKLSRKRFYLLRGGLAENNALVERLKAAEITSRDCYYTGISASPQFVCWLQAGNCESPYCRDISKEDIAKVPEFQVAYNKGLTRYGKKPLIAQDWLTTNLLPNLVSGFYLQRKSLANMLLGNNKPLQSSMTDSVTVKAVFIDIELSTAGKKTETFTVSNILPLEFGAKSYLWACEIEIGGDKPAIMRLQVPENNKPVKNCEVIVRDLKVCKTGSCDRT